MDFFWFHLFLEAGAEIIKKISLVFWSKRWHQKDISKLTDLYLCLRFGNKIEALPPNFDAK